MKKKLNSDGQLVWEIDTTKKTYYYHVRKDSSQYQLWKVIEFRHFDKEPQGVYREGFGLSRNGSHLIGEIRKRVKSNITLIIDTKGTSKLKKVKKGYTLTLKYSDFLTFLKEYSRLNKIKNDKYKNYCLQKLYDLFPKSKLVKKTEFSRDKYVADSFYEMLKSKHFTLGNLSKSDVEAIAAVIPQFIDKFAKGKSVVFSQPHVISIQKKSRRVFLERIIAEFEKMLSKKTHKESEWQVFLRQNILIVNSSYTDVIEKANISLAGKYPDFMLIDTFEYIDIFEIKKPDTTIFKYDESRNNYYWSDEMSRAISQVENYIALLNENALAVVKEIKRVKQIETRIIRPRGFIIVGHSNQLKNVKMEDDFRILSASLKNVDVILYDELLNNVKHFIKNLS